VKAEAGKGKDMKKKNEKAEKIGPEPEVMKKWPRVHRKLAEIEEKAKKELAET